MSTSRTLSMFTLFAACTCAAAAALCQVRATTPVAIQPPAVQTLTIDFPGGTAADYILALREADPAANIVVLGDLSGIALRPVQLKNVELVSALRVLNYVGHEQGNVRARIQIEERGDRSAPIYTIVTDGPKSDSSNMTPQTIVISMADVLSDQLKPADALSAIEAAIALVNIAEPAPAIRFHEETSLLLANGTMEHLNAIRQVVNQLQDATMQRRQLETARSMNERNVASQEENQKLVREVIEWRTRCELLQQTIDQMRRQMTVIDEELRRTRDERDVFRRDLETLKRTAAGPARP